MGGSKTTTSNTVDPKLMALYQQNYNAASNLANTPYTPYGGELVAGFTPAQTQAQGLLGNIATGNTGDDALNNAVNGVTGILGATGAGAPTLAGLDLSPYMNPYQHDVIGTTMAELNQAQQQGLLNTNQNATQDNAFGGTRQSVAEALSNQLYGMNDASTLAQLNASNFGQAQAAGEYDLNHTLANQQLGLQAGTDLASLSAQQLSQAAAKAGLLGAVGEQQQTQQQNVDASAYQQFLNSINWPFQMQQLKNQALGMLPMQQTQTSSTSSSPGLLGILGGVGSLLSPFGI